MRHYVVRTFSGGFFKAESKKDAISILRENENAQDVILSYSEHKNYWHNSVNIVAAK